MVPIILSGMIWAAVSAVLRREIGTSQSGRSTVSCVGYRLVRNMHGQG